MLGIDLAVGFIFFIIIIYLFMYLFIYLLLYLLPLLGAFELRCSAMAIVKMQRSMDDFRRSVFARWSL